MHLPYKSLGLSQKRASCKLCSLCKRKGQRKYTVFKCSTCEKRLCLQSCFYEFHKDMTNPADGCVLVGREEAGPPRLHLPIRVFKENGKPSYVRCKICKGKSRTQYRCTVCSKAICVSPMGTSSCFYKHHKDHYKEATANNDSHEVSNPKTRCCLCSVPVAPYTRTKKETDIEDEDSIRLDQFLLDCFGEDFLGPPKGNCCPEDSKLLTKAKNLFKTIRTCQQRLEEIKDLLRKRKIDGQNQLNYELEDGMPMNAEDENPVGLTLLNSNCQKVKDDSSTSGMPTLSLPHSPKGPSEIPFGEVLEDSFNLLPPVPEFFGSVNVANEQTDSNESKSKEGVGEEDKLQMRPVVLLERIFPNNLEKPTLEGNFEECTVQRIDNPYNNEEAVGLTDFELNDDDYDVDEETVDKDADWAPPKSTNGKILCRMRRKKISPPTDNNVTEDTEGSQVVLIEPELDSFHQPNANRCPMTLCRICFKEVPKNRMWRHVNNAHTIGRPFLCDKCPKTFVTNEKLSAHKMYTHADKVLCPLCPPDKARKYRFLKSHIKIVHEKSVAVRAPFVCEYCGHRFSHAPDGRKHMEKVHLKTYEKVTCNICGKKLSDIRSLTKHKRSQHLSDKKYICSICGVGTLFISHLKAHVTSVHSGVDEDEVERILDEAITNVRRKEIEANN